MTAHPNVALVVMRLVDMHKTHPHQDNSRVCSRCGERVGVYPSGQDVLRHNPKTPIWCAVCADKDWQEGDLTAPAGSFAEIAQELRDSIEVTKQ